MKGATKSAAKYFTRVGLDKVTNTDNFYVSDACIGCGKCAHACLAYAIEMTGGENNRPSWVNNTCVVCFGCLRLCPVEAIRYGVQKTEPTTTG